ncbi:MULTISPECIES: LexA family transcriptional regulator [Elizabethkingia]|uniref:LexA family transcriptional regulator n=1 Tax=Elizabethkingia TaxID=308865 RepID=UPI0014099FEC|nr:MULTISPECIES: hypothetical protein [Elizabethkingia]MBE9391925.1 hypothetical protein [Elizabethkingia anophelis]MBE9405365.1 hypothetical protein [Elizabethkingia anophelis]MDE5525232.1 hypothetical protein [Elizabethkingia meningoseptica]MDV3897707.1 hypothetical protein [Elizabethkingia anophelis]NHQ66968.1 hypothetical protein [Elizabethkingia miricola]
MSDINFRIKRLVEHFAGGNNSVFANMIDVNEANIRNYISGTEPKFNVIEKICKRFEINFEWFILGVGEMEKKNDYNHLISPKIEYSNIIPPIVEIIPSGAANVIMLPAKSAASDFTRALTDPIFYKKNYETMCLPQLQYRKGPFFATEIEGDSMHNTLTHGEWLVGNPIPSFEFIGGYIHTLYHKIHGLITKRLHWIDRENGILLLSSDNEGIDDQEVKIDDISPYMLRAICSVNFNLRNWNNDVRKEIRELKKEVQSIKVSMLNK